MSEMCVDEKQRAIALLQRWIATGALTGFSVAILQSIVGASAPGFVEVAPRPGFGRDERERQHDRDQHAAALVAGIVRFSSRDFLKSLGIGCGRIRLIQPLSRDKATLITPGLRRVFSSRPWTFPARYR